MTFTSHKLSFAKKPVEAAIKQEDILKTTTEKASPSRYITEQELREWAQRNISELEGNKILCSDTRNLYTVANSQLIILADAKAREATDAFIKVLSVIALKRRKTKVADLMGAYEKYLTEARNFVRRHKVDAKAFDNMASKKSVLKGSKEMEDGTTLADRVKEFLGNFRALYRNKIKADMDSISRSQYQILNPLLTLLASPDSSNAYNLVSRYVTTLNDKALTPFYTLTEEDTGGKGNDLLAERLRMLKKLGGDPKTGLGGEALKRAKAKYPNLVREYAKLNRNILTRYKHDVRKVLIGMKKDWAFVEDIIPGLKKLGWPNDRFEQYYSKELLAEKKFIGLNQAAEMTDKFGNSIGVVALGPDRAKITINENYGKEGAKANYVFQIQSKGQVAGGKGFSRKYMTKSWGATSKTENKWTPVNELTKNIEKVKAAWRKALINGQGSAKVYGYLAEALYWTSGRIGAKEGSTDGATTYGISSLLGQHLVSATPQKAKIVYVGKSGQKQTHILDLNAKNMNANDKKALGLLLKWLAARKSKVSKDALIFTTGVGRINTFDFSKWMRKVTGISKFKNHMIRYLRGTAIAQKSLEEAKAEANKLKKSNKLNQKEADRIFKAAITPVAEGLGHFLNEKPNINTSIKSYIQPDMMINWYKDIGMRAPTNVMDALEAMQKA